MCPEGDKACRGLEVCRGEGAFREEGFNEIQGVCRDSTAVCTKGFVRGEYYKSLAIVDVPTAAWVSVTVLIYFAVNIRRELTCKTLF